jgi:anti-sigma factor RsiW
MINCQRIKKDLVAFLHGELEENERELFKAHFDQCPGCREELEEFKKVTQVADVFQEDIDEAMATVDWEALPSQISRNVFRKEVRRHRDSWLTKAAGFLFQPRLKPVYAGLLIGAVLGALITFMVFRISQPTDIAEAERYSGLSGEKPVPAPGFYSIPLSKVCGLLAE